MKSVKKVLVMLLCILMVLESPLSVFAENTVSGNDVVVIGGEDQADNTADDMVTGGTTVSSGDAANSGIVVCSECDQTEGHTENCSQYVEKVTQSVLYEEIMMADSLLSMYETLMAGMDIAEELTVDNLADMEKHVNALYAAIAEPTADDDEYYELLVDMFAYIRGEYGLNGAEVLAESEEISSGSQLEGILDTDKYWKIKNNATIAMEKFEVTDTRKGSIVIPNGVTLTIEGYGSFVRDADNTAPLFYVEEGGKLILKGNNENEHIVIDGKDVVANAPLIQSAGAVDMKYATVQNGKNRAKDSSGNVNSSGGGLLITATGSLTMDHCNIFYNTAGTYGGGFQSYGPVTASNTKIQHNRAMATESYEPGVSSPIGRGRGGGFHLTGAKAVGTFENVDVSYNAAMYYGGGGQVDGNAQLTMNSGQFAYNEAVLHGAGALHLTSTATFIMEGGSLHHNTAHSVGGAIHTSYSCVLQLNGGEIYENIVYGRGGGVHIDVGGGLELTKTEIYNNKAYASIDLNEKYAAYKPNSENRIEDLVHTGFYAAEVDERGDNWNNVKYSSENPGKGDAGYGGGILIDSGTCEMSGGSIYGNHADKGGGGIAFVMILIGTGDRFGYTQVAAFDMSGGKIYNNTTAGNGAGVYLMKNALTEERIASENSWRFVKDTDDKITQIVVQWSDSKEDKYYIETQSGKQYQDANKTRYTAATQGAKPEYMELRDATGKLVDINELLAAVPYVNISGGEVYGNKAQGNGGAAYLEENTVFELSGTGDIYKNKADLNGGAVYVALGKAAIRGGTMRGNNAVGNGGALYISGDVTMTKGTIGAASADDAERDANTATNGGALYVANGNVTIEHGIIDYNSASNSGGAVYLAGDTNTRLVMESGQMKNNTAEEDGGAIFATSGTLEIGLKDCDGTDAALTKHTERGDGRHHPVLTGNTAGDCGGGIAMQGTTDAIKGTGVVHFYCGQATDNEALYKGVGKNVFMYGGYFYYYDGANVGVPRDPDLVIIGGHLISMRENANDITLRYFKNNTDENLDPYEGLASYSEFMNLPEGEYFFETPDGMCFVGWTPYGPKSAESQQKVRDKDDYKPSGTSVMITDKEVEGIKQGTYDGIESDNTMHLYAIWAPVTNNITYVDSLTENESTVTLAVGTETYTIDKSKEQTITIPAANSASHPGFAVVGWYLYQNEDQNANWCDAITVDEKTEYRAYEPVYTGETLSYSALDYSATFEAGGMKYYQLSAPNADLKLTIDPLTFGDITLVAKYELQYNDLTITKTVAEDIDENQTFLFDVIGSAAAKTDNTIKNKAAIAEINELQDIDMQVAIGGNKSTVIEHLPLGIYFVTEDCGWSWRYGETVSEPFNGQVTLGVNAPQTITFTNTRTNPKWLSGDSYCENWWGGTNGSIVKRNAENKIVFHITGN